MTKYILIDEKLGVFLGSYSMQDLIPPRLILEGKENMLERYTREYALFAAQNPFGIYEPEAFDTKDDAEHYLKEQFTNYSDLNVFTAPVESTGEDVCLIDLIKSGYEKYTHDMLMGMPVANDTVH
jgi:hypothetical protein